MKVRDLIPAGLAIVCVVCVFLASPAEAALKKYIVNGFAISQFESSSPRVEYFGGPGVPDSPDSIALIDDSGATPILRKYQQNTGGNGRTILVPALGGFIWINSRDSQAPTDGQAGTGSTASSINWGNLSGWTVTGGTFCHSIPSNICTFARAADLDTTASSLDSSNFDTGTWTFHGTGFIASEYIVQTNTTSAEGNFAQANRGALRQDGTVPAIPLLGIGAVTLSVLAMGVAAVRRRS